MDAIIRSFREPLTASAALIMTHRSAPSAVVAAEGHLVDSQQLKAIFDKVIERGGAFEVQQFSLGRTNDEFSRLKLKVEAPSEPALEDLLEELLPFGCHAVDV